METRFDHRQLISQLLKSPHGELKDYVGVGYPASRQDPEFFARLIAWNATHGTIRDSKVALPVIALQNDAVGTSPYNDNAMAHVALLGAREMERALRFAAEQLDCKPLKRYVWYAVRCALRSWERNTPRWDRIALQNRRTLKGLYALTHTKPCLRAQNILFARLYPADSVFEALRTLPSMAPLEAAGTILERKIPFLIARGALGPKVKDPALLVALMERMSPAELATNAKAFEKLGVMNDPAARGALQKALARVATAPTLKTSRAIAAVQDEELGASLRATQEAQIKRSIDGDWAVLADKSGSMTHAIDAARQVAAILTRSVKGKVHLVFFDTSPRYLDVTGKTFEEITSLTSGVTAVGGTSIGCALDYLHCNKIEVDGIAIVSDGGENTVPAFQYVYQRYCQLSDKEPPVYLYRMSGEPDVFSQRMEHEGLSVNIFDLRSGVDYHSLPTLVQTMRANRYSLVDEILATPLRTLAEVCGEAKEAA